MLFKQLQIFQLGQNYPKHNDGIEAKLEPLKYKKCPPSFASGHGWNSPLEEEHGALMHAVGPYMVFCMKVEEKILPASVVRQEVNDRVKQIQEEQDRKVYQKEKTALREEMTMTLLPKAFSKFTNVFAYIDTKNDLLVVNTTQQDKTKAILSLLKKSLDITAKPLALKKVSYLLAQWLLQGQWPDGLDVLQQAVLEDANDTKRVLRCQRQDLFSNAIQSFIKDGHEVKQLSLAWHGGLEFNFTDKFTFSGLRYSEDLLSSAEEAIETKAQRFDCNMLLMAETLSALLPVMMQAFINEDATADIQELELAEA